MKRISIKEIQYKRTRRIQNEIIDLIKTAQDRDELITPYDIDSLDKNNLFDKQEVLNQMVKDRLVIETQNTNDSTAGRFVYSINYNYFQ